MTATATAEIMDNDACILYNVAPIRFTSEQFQAIWGLRPDESQKVRIYGKTVDTPRRYNVYGISYEFAGQANIANPEVPEILRPFLAYGNSILVNYYKDGNDYIGYHSDDERSLLHGQQIYCFSYGAQRKFKFKHKTTDEVLDIILPNNSLLVMKQDTQKNWKHSLPVMKKITTPRISITIRTMRNI